MAWTEEQREEIARILKLIAEEGLDHPRNLDAALDAIQCVTFDDLRVLLRVSDQLFYEGKITTGEAVFRDGYWFPPTGEPGEEVHDVLIAQ